MSWRTVVITRQAKLEEKLNYLYVRDAESTTKIHLRNIGFDDRKHRRVSHGKPFVRAE